MLEFILEIALMFWITEQEIMEDTTLPEPIEIIETIVIEPSAEEQVDAIIKQILELN